MLVLILTRNSLARRKFSAGARPEGGKAPAMRPLATGLAWLLATTLCSSPGAWAQAPRDSESFRLPPKELQSLIEAPVSPEISLDPTGKWMLLSHRRGYLDMVDLARPEVKLAGLRFSPQNRASVREKTLQGLTLRALEGGPEIPVTGLPRDVRISEVLWSPDGRSLALVQVSEAESQLWLVEVAGARARQVPGLRLNGAAGFDVHWLPDNQSLVVLALPDKEVPLPRASQVPKGPLVQEHQGGKASARTYQDLLQNAHDEDLFDAYLQSQVVRVQGKSGRLERLTPVGTYLGVSPSPDGKFFLVHRLHRPYSYSLPLSSFPIRSEVLDAQGKSLRVIRDLPLETHSPPDFDSVRPGPRALQWRSDAPHSLFWVEALDEGDARKPSEFREQLFFWSPGQEAARPWLRLKLRYKGVDWGSGQLGLVREGWWKTRRSLAWLVSPETPEAPPRTLFDYSSEDRYADPGSPLKKRLASGHYAMQIAADGTSLFLSGAGASPEGDRPFLRRLDTSNLKIEELFRSQAPDYERPYRVLDGEGDRLLLLRESLQSPTNLFSFERTTKKLQPLTQFADSAPQLRAVKKELLTYSRQDGVGLTGTLYTPPGYEPGRDGRLPLLIWAYPGEFKSASAAGQVKDSPYRFIRPFWGGPLFFVMRGYAVLENPTFPIIGEGNREPNDTYLEQLVMNAQAAIDVVVEKGVADRDRCAIGGHSYGAFTAANLLAHSDLFRAGIARSGAYNRTLTPFGFQAEERTFWEAADTYIKMSPFTYAHKIDEPLLLIHGAEDSNSGTYPLQSERLYQAIKGLGGRARLVMLPRESHSYAARESVLHTFYEMDAWLEQHVKQAQPRGGQP